MTEIRVPTLGESVTEATIGRWFKKAGDAVAVDEPLVELETDKVTIEVPASSANLGAGYDCLGVALGLFNRVEVEVRGWSRGEIELTVDGEGVDELTADRTNRCVQGIEAALREVRGELPDGVGWRVEMAPRQSVTYACPNEHRFSVPFSLEADVPEVWECTVCGAEALRLDGTRPEPKKGKPARTHWDMLLERRSVAELEEVLAERLAVLHETQGKVKAALKADRAGKKSA